MTAQTQPASEAANKGGGAEDDDRVCALLRAGGWQESGRFEVTLRDSRNLSSFRAGSVARVVSPDGKAIAGKITKCERGDATEVRLGLLDRRALRSPVGGTVSVAVASAPELSFAQVRVGLDGQAVASQRFHDRLRAWLIGDAEVVTVGRLMQASGEGLEGCLIEVSACGPEIGVVGPGTELQVTYVSPIQLASLTSFDDVGGLEDQIRELHQYAYAPLHAPELYRLMGVTPPRGILLYGPPGTGKTHLARAAASELGVHCMTVSGPELVGTRYGETEASLRRLFSEAVQLSPTVIVIDEIDAVAPSRGASGAQADARIVTQILSLLDGLVALDGIVVLATTNRIEAVDPALRRPGRLDREIFVGSPDERGRERILEIHTRAMPLSDSARTGLPLIAKGTAGFVGADLMALCREAGLAAIERLTSADVDVSGAHGVEVSSQDFDTALRVVQPTGIRKEVASFDAPTWASVYGLHAAKEELLSTARSALTPSSPLAGEGILLTGFPGSGKTALAEGLAGELGANLVRLRGSDVYTKWLGESEQAVREAFELARHLRPTVMFLDHLDSVAPRRDADKPEMASQRVLNELLVELDGNSNDGIVVVGATNMPALVDDSIMRPGRLGIHVEVALPTPGERGEILDGVLQLVRASSVSATARADLVATTEGWTPAELGLLVRRACAPGEDQGDHSFERRMLELAGKPLSRRFGSVTRQEETTTS